MPNLTTSKDYKSGFNDCKQIMITMIEFYKDLEPASKRKVLEVMRALKEPQYGR